MTLEEKIKKQIEKLTKDRIALDAEIKGANQFLNNAIQEMNGLNRAIAELNGLLKEDVKPDPDQKVLTNQITTKE